MPLGALVPARRSRRRWWLTGPSDEAKRAGGRLRPIRPVGAIRSHVRVQARSPPRARRVRGARHRDQRLRRRPLRDDRGRAPCSSAAGSCTRPSTRSCRSERPLSRGIQRFTGITQGDGRRRRRRRRRCCGELADLLEGRVLVAHNARFDVRVLRQAFERAGLDWPAPPALCTVAARAPLRPARAQARRSRRWPARSGSRWTRCTARCPTPSRARACSAPCSRSCARTPSTVGDALDLLALAPARSQDRAGRGDPARPAARPVDAARTTRASTSSATSAGGRCTSASRCRCARARGRTSARPAGWTERAEIVDYRPTNSELGALVLENRLIKRVEADRQREAEAHRPLLLPALPPRHPLPGARGGARAGGRARRERRAAGQPGARRRARRPAHVALPAAPLRAQAEDARAPVGVRADGPLRVALPRRPRPERLPPPARHGARPFRGARRRRARCSRRSTSGCARLPTAERYERAAALLRRRERLAWVLERLDGVLRATHTAPRLVLAQHPVKERFDAFWIVQGRLVDWGPLPGRVRARRADRGRAVASARAAPRSRRTRSTRCASWRAG